MKILVIYSSQSGQLRRILDHIVMDIKDLAIVDYQEIKLVKPFPFPWTASTFFDAMC
jgi:menaquinone-dependent protoporphyrinogen IX oxidase